MLMKQLEPPQKLQPQSVGSKDYLKKNWTNLLAKNLIVTCATLTGSEIMKNTLNTKKNHPLPPLSFFSSPFLFKKKACQLTPFFFLFPFPVPFFFIGILG